MLTLSERGEMKDLELVRTIASAPLRTMRFRALQTAGTNTWRQLDSLVSGGALLRLAHGIYTVPPDGRDARRWQPGLESAGLAIATARHGERRTILMGIGAARHWGAIPRAIGTTVIAVPTAGHHPLTIGSGTVHFVQRDLDLVDAALEETELGRALVTTPEQTHVDLLMRPAQGGDRDTSLTAAETLRPQLDPDEYAQIIRTAPRTNTAIRRTLDELRASR